MRFYSTSFHQNHLDVLAQHLLFLTHEDPLSLCHYSILLPSRRACLNLTQVFKSLNKSIFLPKMYALNDYKTIISDFGLFECLAFDVISDIEAEGIMVSLLKKRFFSFSFSKLLSMASSLLKLYNECEEANISMSSLPPEILLEISEHLENNLNFLKIVFEAFPLVLKELNKVTTFFFEKKLFEALSDQLKKGLSPLMIAGITQPQKNIISFIISLKERDNSYCVFPGVSKERAFRETQKMFNALNISAIGELFSPLNHLASDFSVSVEKLNVSSPFYQAKSIAFRLKEALESKNERVHFICSDRSLCNRVKTELSLYNIDVNDSKGDEISKTLEGDFLIQTLKFLTSPNFSSFFNIAKHPLSKSFLEEEKVEAIKTFEDKIRKNPVPQQSHIQKEKLLQAFPELYTFFKTSLQKELSLSFFLKKHLEFLLFLSPQFFESEIGIFLNEQMKTLEKCDYAYSLLSVFDYMCFFDVFLRKMSSFHKQTQSKAEVQILGMMEARFDSIDFAVIAGLEEGQFPRTTIDDPWLSPKIRKILSLNDHSTLIERQEHDFLLLLCSCQKICISFSKTRNQEAVEPSRFLHHLENIFEKDDDTRVLAFLKHSQKRFLPHNLPLPHAFYNHPIALEGPCKPKILSPTSLTLLIADPYGFYAKYLLKLTPYWSLYDDGKNLLFGQAFHKSMHDFYQKHQHLTNNHKEELIALLKHNLLKMDFPLTPLMTSRLNIIAEKLIVLDSPNTSIKTEVKGSFKHHLLIRATADRIDVLEDGDAILYDYKTGSLPTSKELEKGYAPQILIEGLMYQNKGFFEQTHVALHDLCFIKIGQTQPFVSQSIVKNLEELLEKAKDGLSEIIDTYLSPHFVFHPTPNPNNEPSFNPYQHLERSS